MQQFRELEAQDMRDHWADEARNFIPWLKKQIKHEGAAQLEDVLGLDNFQ